MSSPSSHIANRYRFVETLGRGGMGEVWKAYDERLNRYCAIKVLRQTQDSATVERFSREARTLANIRHPGVVIVYDYGIDNDRPYLVMELLPGPSLAELLRAEGPLPIETVRRYGSQAASALQAVHDAGVVHRDIKPANLVIDNTGAIRLVDFGIALGSVADQTLTEHGAIIGSAAYLAPEQAVGGRADARSDLYGFGCLLVTLLTGRPPFDDDSPVEILTRHLNDSPVRPSDRRPDVPPDIDALVMQLLAKQPEQRPASAAEVAARLGGDRGTRPLPGPVPMPPRGAAPQVTYRSARGESTATMAAAVPPRRNNQTWLVVLGILVLLGAGGAAWALTQNDDSSGGTAIPFVHDTPTPTPSPVPSVSVSPSASPTIGPPPTPNPLATPTPTLVPTPTPTPITILPTPIPFPETEMAALEDAVTAATYSGDQAAAAKQDLTTRTAAIRQAITKYVNADPLSRAARRADALDKISAFKGAVDDLKTATTIDDATASTLSSKADALAAKLT